MATTHKCNKEKEITILTVNMTEMRESHFEIKQDVKEIKEILFNSTKHSISDETELKYMKKAVFGNGKPGLLQRVESLELKIAFWAGGGVIIGFIGSITINWLMGKI